ncbi:MAG: hypothetical protein ACTHMM_21280 [Agriterribacter sp.]
MMFETDSTTQGPFLPCHTFENSEKANIILARQEYDKIIFDRDWQAHPNVFIERPIFSEPTFNGFTTFP